MKPGRDVIQTQNTEVGMLQDEHLGNFMERKEKGGTTRGGGGKGPKTKGETTCGGGGKGHSYAGWTQ